MKRCALAVLATALAAVLVPAVALAKGPIEATVSGPGLGSPIQFGDWENWGEEDAMAAHQPVMELAEGAGFFPAAFGPEQSPMLDLKPKGDLGPRYLIEYRVPGPNNDEFRITQDLYPYAKPHPVTYMAPRQPLFHGDGTSGGWYVAATPSRPALMPVLTDAGLPESPPTAGDGSKFPWTTAGTVAGAAALLGLGALGVFLVRRRSPHPVT